MFLLGLTGDIACGKSTVARLLANWGAVHLDADLLVRELYDDADFSWRVASLFPAGAALLDARGAVDRRALGELVFQDGAALQKLEELVHPAVLARRDEKLCELAQQQPPPRYVVVEAVKLVEGGAGAGCDVVWWIACSPPVQTRRLMETRGLSEEAARQRLQHQPDATAKRRLLGSTPLVEIANDSSLHALEQTVKKQWKALDFEKQL